MDDTCVVIELYGPARLAAGRASLALPLLHPAVLADVSRELVAACPGLRGAALGADGALLEGFTWNLNGRAFISDPATAVTPGDHLLLLASAAGGAG